MTASVLVALAVAVVVLAHLHRRAREADAAERRRLFDDVVGLFEEPRRDGDGVHRHPVLTGRFAGHPVTVRAIVDAVALRKLPVLWVEIVVHRALDVGGTLNVLLRPAGTEFFSPDAGFVHELAPPAGLAGPARVSCASPRLAPPVDVLAPAIGLLAEPDTKELGVGRAGLRVVLRVAEGDQASYRTTRRAVFGRPRLRADALERAVAVLGAVGDGVGDRVGVGR